MGEKAAMRRKVALRNRILAVSFVLWACIFVIALVTIKNAFFIGLSADDVTYLSKISTVDYTVTSVRQSVQAETGEIQYKVTFRDETEIAPEFSVEISAIPADMALGNVYAARWLRVTGSADGYSRSKDLISVRFAEQALDNTAVTELRNDVYEALAEVLGKRLDILFYPFCLIAFTVFAVVCTVLARLSSKLADKWFVPDEWDKLQQEIDSRSAKTVPDSNNADGSASMLSAAQKYKSGSVSVAYRELPAAGETVRKPMQKPAGLKPVQEDIVLSEAPELQKPAPKPVRQMTKAKKKPPVR